MSVSDKPSTLRAQMKHHEPVVCYPINTMVATRGGRDDMRTTFGIGEDGDPQFTISAAHSHAVCYRKSYKSPKDGGVTSGCQTR